MRDLLPEHRPALLLAPMQDVTDLPFLRIMARRGGPDIFVTEYFRVHQDSRLEPHILRSVCEHGTGRPVFAQMIGQDVAALVRTARELLRYPVAGIDLNLGCPAPVVCRKDAGGGLLRYPERIDAILGALREATAGARFTVKCRLGFEDAGGFARLLEIFAKHRPEAVTIHARTVRDGYRTPVQPEAVAAAERQQSMPVIANWNVVDVATGQAWLRRSAAAGLMIGRGAIRNPWIFAQLRSAWGDGEAPQPRGCDVLAYIRELWDETAECERHYHATKQVARMKKYLCYISQGMDHDGSFEYRIRRAADEAEFFAICHEYLAHGEAVPATPPVSSALFSGFAELLSGQDG
jgi:tRNA-dihydrouridine synthase C